jgi:hypothetical protein
MWWFRLALLTLVAGCPDNPQPPACTTIDLTCAPGYTPDFDSVYQNTISASCAQSASCHSATGHTGNLDMSTEALAYTELLQNSSIDPSRKRVVPGDAACSLMVVRIEATGEPYQMPKGGSLLPPARCAIAQWVQNGACGPGLGTTCP